jgi:uncharacterized protein YceK
MSLILMLFSPDKLFVRFMVFSVLSGCFSVVNNRGQEYGVIRERNMINEIIKLND